MLEKHNIAIQFNLKKNKKNKTLLFVIFWKYQDQWEIKVALKDKKTIC